MIFYLIIIKIKPFDFLFFNFNGWALLPSLAELFCSLSAYQYRKQSTLNDMLLHFNYFYVQNLEPQRRQKQSKAPLFFPPFLHPRDSEQSAHTLRSRKEKGSQFKAEENKRWWMDAGVIFQSVYIIYIVKQSRWSKGEGTRTNIACIWMIKYRDLITQTPLLIQSQN